MDQITKHIQRANSIRDRADAHMRDVWATVELTDIALLGSALSEATPNDVRKMPDERIEVIVALACMQVMEIAHRRINPDPTASPEPKGE